MRFFVYLCSRCTSVAMSHHAFTTPILAASCLVVLVLWYCIPLGDGSFSAKLMEWTLVCDWGVVSRNRAIVWRHAPIHSATAFVEDSIANYDCTRLMHYQALLSYARFKMCLEAAVKAYKAQHEDVVLILWCIHTLIVIDAEYTLARDLSILGHNEETEVKLPKNVRSRLDIYTQCRALFRMNAPNAPKMPSFVNCTCPAR